MDPRGRKLLIVGDSLSAAATAPGGVLAAELRRAGAADVRVDARVGRSAVNLWNGTNGETGTTVAAEAARRPEIVIVMLGTNDAASGVSPAKDEAGFRRLVAAFPASTEWWAVGPPGFPGRPDIEARTPPVYETLVRVFGRTRVLDTRPLTPTTGRAADGVHFTAAGAAPYGRAIAAALLRAGTPAAAAGASACASCAIVTPAPAQRWGWTFAGLALAVVGVGVAVVVRRRRQLAGTFYRGTALGDNEPLAGLGAARDRIVGTDYPAEVVHGTTKKSAQAFLQRRDLPEHERTRTLSEFGSGVLYVAEKTAPHQAVMFGSQGGRTLLALQLAPGRRVLDVASEMQRRPFIEASGPIAFKGRPSITDDMGRWLTERRAARGLRPIDVALVDPTSPRFSPSDYPDLLATYARDRGYAAVRFTDETVVVDPTAVVGARRLKPTEVTALRTVRRRLPATGPASLYTRDFEDDSEPLEGGHRRRRELIPGGLAPDGACPLGTDPRELRRGVIVEMEHTTDHAVAHEIACDHLTEDPRYYTKLAKVEP